MRKLSKCSQPGASRQRCRRRRCGSRRFAPSLDTPLTSSKDERRLSTWLTTIVINSARIKLRRRLSQVQLLLDEPCGEQNLSLANTLSDSRPDPEEAHRKRQIAKRLAHATSRVSS